MTVDERGNDIEMTDQIQDCRPGLHQQTIHPMMAQGIAQMVTDPGLVIWTVIGLLQEVELAHRLSTRISLAMGPTEEDEMIGLQGMTVLREMTGLQETIDFQEKGMTVLEDVMIEMSGVTRIEIEIGWITTSAADIPELGVEVEVQSVIASERE